MNILVQVGTVLFVVMWGLGLLVKIFDPVWYWKKFIPRLYEKENKHPIITIIVVFILFAIMMLGLVNAIFLI